MIVDFDFRIISLILHQSSEKDLSEMQNLAFTYSYSPWFTSTPVGVN